MEFGQTLGLAQSFQANERINDLYRQEESLNRAKAMAEKKAEMFANDTRYQNAMNSFDNKLVKERNQKAVYSLGEWQRNNPNWRIDPTLRAQYQNMIDDIKGNEDVIRGMASDGAFKALDADLQEVAKSGKQYNKRAYNDLLMQKNNYLQFGNQNGFDAAQKEGYKAFTYIKPKEFIDDMAGDLLKSGDSIQDYNIIKPKNGNIGEWYSEAKPEAVEATKKFKVQQHYDQLMQMKEDNGWNDAQLDKYVTDNILAGVKKNYSIGDANARFRNYIDSEQLRLHKAKAAGELMQNNPSYTPFDFVIDPKTTAGTLAVDDIKAIWNNKPTQPLMGTGGEKIDVSDLPIDFSGQYIKNQGLPFFLGKINVPLDIAQQRGLYEEPFGPDFGRKGSIASPFVKVARIKEGTDKDGKTMRYVEVDYNMAVNPHDKVARDKFNAIVLPDKLVEPGMNPYGTSRSAQTVNINGQQVPVGTRIKYKGKEYTVTPNGLAE